MGKFVRVSSSKLKSMLKFYKIFSYSIEDDTVIIKQFNSLPPNIRISIAKEYKQLEKYYPHDNGEHGEDFVLINRMVAFNIVASRYNINPATVSMCLSPPCKVSEKILNI